MKSTTILATLALTTFVACNDIPLEPMEVSGSVSVMSQSIQADAVDILWVIDDSASMKEEQEELAAQFNAFITTFAELGTDWQMAVITTDVRDPASAGMFRTGPGAVDTCVAPPEALASCEADIGPVLAARDYRAVADDPESPIDMDRLQADFTCIASVGTCGWVDEGGLAAVELALSPERLTGPNQGFLRPDAILGVVFVTDEDDCSAQPGASVTGEECYTEEGRAQLTPVSQTRDAILAAVIAADPSLNDVGDPEAAAMERVFISGIIGPETAELGEIACTAPGGRGVAADGPRYRELIELLGGTEASICAEGFAAPLRDISTRIAAGLGYECLDETFLHPCADTRDCAGGATCLGPIAGASYCSDYRVTLESRAPGSDTWTTMVSPGTFGEVVELGASEQYQMLDAAPAAAEYWIDYADTRCSSGASVSFANGARPEVGADVRVVYPVSVGERELGEVAAFNRRGWSASQKPLGYGR